MCSCLHSKNKLDQPKQHQSHCSKPIVWRLLYRLPGLHALTQGGKPD